MELNLIAPAQASSSDAKTAKPVKADEGFELALDAAKSGAPPGPEPPPTSDNVEEEVASLGPNAQPLNPDFLPETPIDNADKAGTEAIAPAIIAALAVPPAPGVVSTADATKPATNDAKPTASSVRPTPVADSKPQAAAAPTDLAADKPQAASTSVQPVARKPLPQSSPEGKHVPHATSGSGVRRYGNPLFKDAPDDTGKSPRPTSASSVGPKASLVEEDGTCIVGVTTTPDAVNDLKPANLLGKKGQKEVEIKVDGEAAVDGEKDLSTLFKKVERKDAVLFTAKDRPDVPQVASTATTAADVAKADKPTPRLPAGEVSLVVKQVADRIQLLAAARPREGVTIHLQPAHLGSITMTVRSLSGMIEAEISASNTDVRQALEQNRAMLGQALEQRGYKLEQVTIAPQAEQTASSNSHGHNRQMAQQQQSQSQHASHQHLASSRSTAFGDAAGDRSRRVVKSATGVDYWI